MTGRTVTLDGALVGPIWWPSGVEAELPLSVDLTREAARIVNANGSGLVDAVMTAVVGAGDFVSARLSRDSIVLIEHRRPTPHGWVARSRIVNVTDLPSLADFVVADADDSPER
jgi:hypothetical protein